MALVRVRIKHGNAFSIYVLEENGECPLIGFLDSLNGTEAGIIRRYWEHTKDIGLITNPMKSKKLESGLYYWRTRNGVRLFYFTDAGKVVVCANGYVKKKDDLAPAEIKRAEIWKAKYEAARNSGTLKTEDRLDMNI